MDMSVVSYSVVRTVDGNIELWLIVAWLVSVVGIDLVTNECTNLVLWDG